jgi:pyridoxal phosphate enzyme (YggS family)
MGSVEAKLQQVRTRIATACATSQRPVQSVTLLAVTKTFGPQAVRDAFDAGQRAFGENYVQEAQAKIMALGDAGLEWHLIGRLQSNKAREAAALFDWVQSVDRAKLVAALATHRDPARAPLNVLVQVNIDDESSKHGCAPGEIPALAAAIAAQPQLALRGLMAIPAPLPDPERRRDAFHRMRTLFEQLRMAHPQADTLSMGMSEDAALAVAEGATMVRVGTALFGARPAKPGSLQ